MQDAAFLLAVITLLGIGAQWAAWWLKLPAILLLLILGLAIGPLTGWLNPDDLLGGMLFPFVSIGVAIILFEGGLTLRWHEIKGQGNVLMRLITLGVAITWLSVATATWWLLGINWEIALLFGALVTVTGPTVIGPLLRTVKPNAKISSILRWEGILIDPIGALLAVLVFEFIISSQQETETYILILLVKAIGIGIVIGTVGALCLGLIIKHHLMPEYLHNVAALALVMIVFTSANAFQHESGLLAVTLMGMILANRQDIHTRELLNFKANLSVLFISIMFIILAARIEWAQLQQLGVEALILLAFVIFISRPLAVGLSTIGSDLTWRERSLVSWIGPRGIVAAAVSALFALKLEDSGHESASMLVPLTFMVIVGTVVVQSLTARSLAKWLNVAEPNDQGVLIAGANEASLKIGEALTDVGLRVLVADPDWERVNSARMAGFDTYYGNILSSHAERNLNLAGIGHLFAMTSNSDTNALVCANFKHIFGANSVFRVRTLAEEKAAENRTVTDELRGLPLFGEHMTLAAFTELVTRGALIKSTSLTEDFDLYAYHHHNEDRTELLFALDTKCQLHVCTPNKPLDPEAGWQIVAINTHA